MGTAGSLFFTSRGHRRARRGLASIAATALIAGLLGAAGLVAGASSAGATNAGFLPQTSFAIDGNPTGANDFENPYGPGTTPGGYKTTGLYYVKRNIDMGGTTGCDLALDDQAVSGTKLGAGPIWPSVTAGGLDPKKTDLDYIDVAAEKVDVNGDIEDILYLGYKRCSGTGTWQAVLYLDDGDNLAPTQGDTNGDFLVVFEFEPSNGQVIVTLYKRVNGEWTAQTPPRGTIDGKANDTYGEVAINLTTLGILPDDTCRTISVSGQGASVPGGSLSSVVKDLVQVVPLNISNCGGINIKKAATGARSPCTRCCPTTTAAPRPPSNCP